MEIADFSIRNTGKRTTIHPFGCVHADHPSHNKRLWQDFLAESKEKDAYLIGMGDYIDFARTHFKQHIRSYQGDDESILHVDRMVRERIEEFAESLMPFKGKIMGLLDGNHNWTFTDGSTSTQYLCQLLECKYLGLSAFVRLAICHEKKRDVASETFLILAHHGMGSGGAYIASDIGKFERQIAPGWEADIYLSSHTHRKAAVVIPTLTVNKRGQGRLIEKPRLFAKTGCFKRAYCEGATSRSFEESKLFHPSSMGWVSIYIDRIHDDIFERRRKGREYDKSPIRQYALKHEY